MNLHVQQNLSEAFWCVVPLHLVGWHGGRGLALLVRSRFSEHGCDIGQCTVRGECCITPCRQGPGTRHPSGARAIRCDCTDSTDSTGTAAWWLPDVSGAGEGHCFSGPAALLCSNSEVIARVRVRGAFCHFGGAVRSPHVLSRAAGESALADCN